MSDDNKGITVGELIPTGRRVVMQCNDCKNKRLIDPATLKVKPETLVTDLGKLARCTACGGKGALSYPESARDVRQGRER